MVYSAAFGSLSALILGVALLRLWRRYPEARFTRDIGLHYLALAVTPVLYLAYAQSGAAGQAVALTGTLASGVAYLTFLLLGMVHLANRRISHAQLALLVLGLSALLAYPLALHSWSLASAASGLVMLGVGAVAWRWLWSSRKSERWVGPLLCLVGAMQFLLPFGGEGAAQVQMTANTVLRLVLALMLFQTALQRATEEADRLREQYERLTRNSHQGIGIAHDLKIVYCNPAFLRIYGVDSLSEISPEWVNAGIEPDELAAVMALRSQVLSGKLEVARWEGPRRRKDGTLLHLRFAVWRTEWNGQPALQTVITDETQQRDTMAAMLHQASHDELTGLPNRGTLLRRLRERCQSAADGDSFGLVLLDVDRFKLFNDAHGHSLGDQVLQALVDKLQRELGAVAELSRLGSDGFAILARPGVDASKTEGLVQRVRQALSWPLVLSGKDFFVDVSMGVALFPQTGADAETLLRSANAAMHEAKKIAGTSMVVAEQRFVQGSGEVLEQEQALRAGIINHEFSLAYQPKVDAATGALMGFEALARWRRADGSTVNPVQFIAAAERTGLIGTLGMLLLSQVCEQQVRWRGQAGQSVPVAVNVSPLQLLDPGFPQRVQDTLLHHGVPVELITLEVTETAALGNMELARAQLAQLRDLGLKVAMDDFGTGFSSLDMLRRLPLSVVKIDRSLVDPMPAADAVAVVRAICQLADALRLRVVAEGVETEAQATAALLAGCHELQGYLYARPLPPEQALLWLRSGSKPD